MTTTFRKFRIVGMQLLHDTLEEFCVFVAEALVKFDTETLQAFAEKLERMGAQVRDLIKIHQLYDALDAPMFVVVARAQELLEKAHIFKLEGIIMDLLAKHNASPLTLKRAVNANVAATKAELSSIKEGYTFELKKINGRIAAQVAKQSTFSKKA